VGLIRRGLAPHPARPNSGVPEFGTKREMRKAETLDLRRESALSLGERVMQLALLSALNAERAARRAAILVTETASGEQRLVREAEVPRHPLAPLLAERLRSGKSGTIEADGRQLFLNVQVPPVKAVVIGAVHISQALAPMARGLDLDVTIIDPRTAFATPERFPDVQVLAEWPDAVLPRLGLDRYTALLALTHDPKIDDPALVAALRAECFYIGALGSKKTHARRVERLTAAGFGETDIARIHAPVGLDIGAVSPAEIAVSVLAELIAALRRDRRRSP
jgi:xanthine dehydrogenase accessory factor